MEMTLIVFNLVLTCALYDAVFGYCSSDRHYIQETTTSPPRYNHYYYRERTTAAPNYYDVISCKDVSEIAPSALQCPDSKCKSLTFENSNVSKIPTNVFMEAQSLEVINLSNSSVRIIETGAFLGLLKVKEIHLEINSISKVTRGSFNSLISLEFLNLSRNSIREIESESFHGSSSIKHLDLSYNELTSIPTKLLEPLNLLESLNISNNLLITLNNNLCSNLIELRNLILSNNRFSQIDDCIEGLLIKTLSLSNNHLSTISNISFNNTLEYLRVDNNYISELNEHIFKNLSNLKLIDFSRNSVSDFPSDIFRDLDNVELLDISNNEITYFNSLAFSELKQLSILNINGNNITYLQRKVFQNLSHIETLDISSNSIRYIPLDVLSDLMNLKTLNISGNEIEYLESGVFNNLNNLRILDISYNNLKTLKPHIFFPLKQIRILNIAYNNLESLQVTDIILHCPNMEVLDINGNIFSCSELAQILSSTVSETFSIKSGNTMSSENVIGIACTESKHTNDFINLFNNDFENSSFYKFFHNFNRENIFSNNINFPNSSQLFIDQLSRLVEKLNDTETQENSAAIPKSLFSNMEKILKNESSQFQNFLNDLSEIADKLRQDFAKLGSSINNSINYRLTNNVSHTDNLTKQEQNPNFNNFSFDQFLKNLSVLSENLEKQLCDSMNKLTNLISSQQTEIEFFIKFENSSFRNLIYELTKMSKRIDDINPLEQISKAEGRVSDASGTMTMIPEIGKLTSALNQLKLFIILGILISMVIFSIKIYKYVKTDYIRRKKSALSSLELPMIDR